MCAAFKTSNIGRAASRNMCRRRPDFALERLVTHQLPLDQINEGMRLARAQQAIKVLVVMRDT